MFIKLIKSVLPIKFKQKLRPFFLSSKYSKHVITPTLTDNMIQDQKNNNRFKFELEHTRQFSTVTDNIFSQNEFVLVFGSNFFVNIFSMYVGPLISPKLMTKIFTDAKKDFLDKDVDIPVDEIFNFFENYFPQKSCIYVSHFSNIEQIRKFFL